MHGWSEEWRWHNMTTSWKTLTPRGFLIAKFALLAGWILFIGSLVEGLSPDDKSPFSVALQRGRRLHQSLLAECDPLRTSNVALPTSRRPLAFLPVGLHNLKNTCYMNAVLQSLFSVKEFSLGLTLNAFSFKKNTLGSELVSLFQRMQGGEDESETRKRFRLALRPTAIADALRLDVRVQEDAEELLLKILNALDESVDKKRLLRLQKRQQKQRDSSPSPSRASLTTNEENDSDCDAAALSPPLPQGESVSLSAEQVAASCEDIPSAVRPTEDIPLAEQATEDNNTNAAETVQEKEKEKELLATENDEKETEKEREKEQEKEKEKEQDEDIAPTAAVRLDLRQTMRCVEMNHVSSEKRSTHFDLSVEIKDCLSLDEAIQKYFTPELLNGANKYKCSVHGLQDAEKSLKIVKFPRVLITHLKRFSFDPVTYSMKKIVDPIDVPVSLDLTPYAADDLSQSISRDSTAGKYSLQAVIVHEGSLDFGHYYAFAKLPLYVEGKELPSVYWVKLNDHEVTIVDEETVLRAARGGSLTSKNPRVLFHKALGDAVSTNAYMLFYTQIE